MLNPEPEAVREKVAAYDKVMREQVAIAEDTSKSRKERLSAKLRALSAAIIAGHLEGGAQTSPFLLALEDVPDG